MAETDVHDLARESLASSPFPADRGEAFRVFLADKVHQGVWQHASADTSHEICGVLVGTWARDADGPFAQITEFIRCDNAAQKFAEVTFTHESWAQINGEMDTKYQNLRIIGWYHSHPNFGIFLSDRDCFIQEHFFSGAGQIALVVDPVRKIEGIFEWRKGKPVSMHHYWVGNRVLMGVAEPRVPAGTPMNAVPAESAAPAGGVSNDGSSGSMVMVMLVAVLMLLLGYLYGGQRSMWEQQRLAEGTVAHYGLWKLYKPGFEEYMAEVITAQRKITDDLKKIHEQWPKANEETRLELEKSWKTRQGDMQVTIDALKIILAKYGLDQVERDALLNLIGDKTRQLSDVNPETSRLGTPRADESEKPKSGNTEATKDQKSESKPKPAAKPESKTPPKSK